MNEEMNNLPKNGLQDIDIELLKRFIGKNSEKILCKKFSIPGFFFGAFYAAYRKMFVFAILYVLATSILSVALSQISSILGLIIAIIINIIYGFFAYKLYIKHAIKKINKLRNNNSLNESIDSACIRKGGTSIGLIFALILIDILIVFVIITIMGALIFGMFFNSLSSLSDTSNEDDFMTYIEMDSSNEIDLENSVIEDESNSFEELDKNDESSDSDVNLSELIKIEFPECFEATTENGKDKICYEWETDFGSNTNCIFELSIADGVSDAEQAIYEKAEVNNVSNYVGTKKSNGIIWHYFKTQYTFPRKTVLHDSDGTVKEYSKIDESTPEITYYHATEKDGKVYWAEYKIEKNVIGKEDREKAMEYYNDIFSSIQWVE